MYISLSAIYLPEMKVVPTIFYMIVVGHPSFKNCGFLFLLDVAGSCQQTLHSFPVAQIKIKFEKRLLSKLQDLSWISIASKSRRFDHLLY